MSLPLPPGFFECPPLSSGEVSQLRLLADKVCTDAIATALATAKLPTTKMLTHPRTKRVAHLHLGTDLHRPEIDAVTGVSRIATSYDQLHTFYDVATSKQLRTFGTVASQTLLDRVMLYSVEQSRSTRFCVTSILWAAMQSTLLGKGVLAKRDACYLECLRDVTVVDERGRVRNGFVRIIHSIDLDCCPSLQATHRFARGYIYRSGHVFLETDMDGAFDFYSIYAGQPMGKIPRLLGRKVMERIVGEMLNLEDYFCADDVQSRLIRQRRLSLPVPFRANASYCDVCFGAFKLLSHKLQCYFCHHIACTRCAHIHVATSTLGTKKVRICTHCYCPPIDKVARRTSSLTDGAVLRSRSDFVMQTVDIARPAIDVARGGCINDDDDGINLSSRVLLPKLAQEPRAVRSASTDSTESGSDAADQQLVGIFGLDSARTALDSMSSFGSYATTVIASSVRLRTG